LLGINCAQRSFILDPRGLLAKDASGKPTQRNQPGKENRMRTKLTLTKQQIGYPALLTALASLAFLPAQAAESYETRVVVSGLNRPTGIVAEGSKTLYITQVPTPGVPGSSGGQNSVDRISLGSGRIRNLTTGEPEPTNLALDGDGRLYWTCKSAGVILTRSEAGDVSLFLGGLQHPSGIAADPWNNIYFTQIPTPGVPGSVGGINTVNVTDGTTITTLSMGEPEPVDIAVSRSGDAYWTCKTAGVILKRSADGTVGLLLDQLNAPTGIALDHHGEKLYFTETPTPGVSGALGGQNAVWVYHLQDGQLELVDAGDPEPTDITVAPNGRVFWTCSSAGVIVEARHIGDHGAD
jgi:DNA-binding beta-propeller fold protein YncE